MLHVLLELQKRSPVKFQVAAATVNPETPEFAPEPLIEARENPEIAEFPKKMRKKKKKENWYNLV